MEVLDHKVSMFKITFKTCKIIFFQVRDKKSYPEWPGTIVKEPDRNFRNHSVFQRGILHLVSCMAYIILAASSSEAGKRR